MSAKWRRSLAWDERVFPAWAAPVKWALRAFSSVWLAVSLLSLVALYCALASTPVGLLALIPTYVVYALTLLIGVGLITSPAVLLLRRVAPAGGAGFALVLLGAVASALAAAALWKALVWPALRYDAATGHGFRLFADFVRASAATTLRRLPAFEMTEPQFYSWWPLRLLLWLFVANLVIATVRRIELRFANIGVLTVHTGIVILALGSAQYASLKREGDALLLASLDDPSQPGPPVSHFYDRDEPALWLSLDGGGWEQRPLIGLPRYNDYGVPWSDRALDLSPRRPTAPLVDPAIGVRIIGFASYAALEENWMPAPLPADAGARNPALRLELRSRLRLDVKSPQSAPLDKPEVVATATLPERPPGRRLADLEGALLVERVPDGDDARWSALAAPLPPDTRDALVIDVAETGERRVQPLAEGAAMQVGGYRISVERLLPSAPFPIITPGYEGADSPVAILRIEPPDAPPYQRYVYTLYPEISQDILGVQPDGRPIRRDADPALRIWRIDASRLSVHIRGDEAVVRLPGGAVSVVTIDSGTGIIPIAPRLDLRIADRFEHVQRVEAPAPTPLKDRRKDLIGTYAAALLGVEVSLAGSWRKTEWVPFSKYLTPGAVEVRDLALPDGRTLSIAFSRVVEPLPGVRLQLVDFEMIPYPHSDTPRDYVSRIRVTDMMRGEQYERIARLNRPLLHHPPNRLELSSAGFAAALGSLLAKLAPNTYKFSQMGWDQQGWMRSKAQTEMGLADRPRAAFTILAVGNNPGIRIIALGAILFAVGVPWAFYVKPWLLRRKSRRLRKMHTARQAQHAPLRDDNAPTWIASAAVKPEPVQTAGATP